MIYIIYIIHIIYIIYILYITSKDLTIPDLSAANAGDGNPALAPEENYSKPFVKPTFTQRLASGGNSYRPPNPIINPKSF